MGSVIILVLLVTAGFTAIFLPWIGVAGAYLIGLLNPQSIWWWNFEGVRPVYWMLIPTLIGVGLVGVQGRLRWDALANVRVLCLLIIWTTGMMSWWLAPYSLTTVPPGESITRSAQFIMENLTKILILMALGLLLINRPVQIKIMSSLMVMTGLYLTWWINNRYFFEGAWGRIGGPMGLSGEGTYSDENTFAALFVAVFPFIWYTGFATRKKTIRIGVWCILPFIWHGLFLTGSRGGVLALGLSMLIVAIRMRNVRLSAILVSLFVIAFVWQAGDTMKERIGGLDSYSEDESATGRLDAWEAGGRMMMKHPLTGVGPGAFLRAFPDYSEKQPRQAHNTFVQFGAEFGVISLVALLVLFISSINVLWKSQLKVQNKTIAKLSALAYTREATLSSLVGIIGTGLFVSQQIFELMYFLIFMTCVLANNGCLSEADRREPKAEDRIKAPLY